MVTTLWLAKKEPGSSIITAGDPGKSRRGIPAWNTGKSFKNTETAKENKRKAALLREQRKREAKLLQQSQG